MLCCSVVLGDRVRRVRQRGDGALVRRQPLLLVRLHRHRDGAVHRRLRPLRHPLEEEQVLTLNTRQHEQ